MPVVQVVILNWNGREHLERFLPSVVANTPDAEIIVADNGSDDDSCEFIEMHYPEVSLFRMDENHGYAGGYNRVLSSSLCDSADYWVLLNSDVETPSGWLSPLIERMGKDPQLGFLAPKILSYNDRSRFEYAGASGGFLDGLGYPFCRGRILNHTESDIGQYNDFRRVFWASGACMVARKEAFRDAGGLDEDFFAHMEEIDLCWRAQLRGWKIAVEPASAVFHLGGGTLGQSSYKTYLNYRNNLAMLFKNLSSRSRVPVIFLRMILDAIAATVYLVSGRPGLFRSVYKAHKDYRKMKPALRIKRDKIREGATSSVYGIWKGPIIVRYFIGIRRFGKLL